MPGADVDAVALGRRAHRADADLPAVGHRLARVASGTSTRPGRAPCPRAARTSSPAPPRSGGRAARRARPAAPRRARRSRRSRGSASCSQALRPERRAVGVVVLRAREPRAVAQEVLLGVLDARASRIGSVVAAPSTRRPPCWRCLRAPAPSRAGSPRRPASGRTARRGARRRHRRRPRRRPARRRHPPLPAAPLRTAIAFELIVAPSCVNPPLETRRRRPPRRGPGAVHRPRRARPSGPRGARPCATPHARRGARARSRTPRPRARAPSRRRCRCASRAGADDVRRDLDARARRDAPRPPRPSLRRRCR